MTDKPVSLTDVVKPMRIHRSYFLTFPPLCADPNPTFLALLESVSLSEVSPPASSESHLSELSDSVGLVTGKRGAGVSLVGMDRILYETVSFSVLPGIGSRIMLYPPVFI